MTAFGDYLRTLVQAHGGPKQDFARALGLKPPALSQLFTRATPPSVELCLEIAWLTRTSPIRILRIAKHDKIADWLETLFQPPRPDPGVTLTGAEQQHLAHWRRLTSDDRLHFQKLMRRIIEGDTMTKG